MEKSPAEQREHPPRNLLTNYDETYAAMAELEGPAWVYTQEQDSGEVTVAKALKAIEHRRKLRAELGMDDDEEKNPIAAKVYGDGGIDRFLVRLDGTVEFSRHHAYPEEKVAKAEALGFSIN